MFALADTFDAITSNRPYRTAQGYEQAREVIEAESGHQFDPLVVQAFLSIDPHEWQAIRAEVELELADWRQHRARFLAEGYDSIRRGGQRTEAGE
jgi:HD-GYP domain-containing protein (c-di-GMP phosphodiesterase class II)